MALRTLNPSIMASIATFPTRKVLDNRQVQDVCAVLAELAVLLYPDLVEGAGRGVLDQEATGHRVATAIDVSTAGVPECEPDVDVVRGHVVAGDATVERRVEPVGAKGEDLALVPVGEATDTAVLVRERR